MRRFIHFEQYQLTPVITTEEQIIREYFPQWSKRMVEMGYGDSISKENCIDDWMVTNWAVEVDDLNNEVH